MKAKPLAFTIIVLGILALAADTWLVHSSSAGLLIEQGQLVPVATGQVLQESELFEEAEEPLSSFIPAADSLETTRSVAQKLKDLTLAANIEKKLFRIKALNGIDFQVVSNNGLVELSGAVSTEKEQQSAVSAAQRVAGVKSVINKVEVQ